MVDINKIEHDDLGKNSNIRLNICETEVDMYWKVAIEVLETIVENNRKNVPTLMVVPYGPLGPYSRLVYLINKYRVSLKDCVFINMDEYLTEDGKYIDREDPLSFLQIESKAIYLYVDQK